MEKDEGIVIMTSMDTLKAARELEAAGVPKAQAEAISRVLNDIAREDLVTKHYLDIRLLQHTMASAALFVTIAGLFKLFT